MSLQKDPNGLFDAVGAAGSTATVSLTSNAFPGVQITAASMRGASIQVNGNKVKVPALVAGSNVLRLTFAGPRANDDITLVDVDNNGATTDLTTAFVGAAPGGGDPVANFTIHAE